MFAGGVVAIAMVAVILPAALVGLVLWLVRRAHDDGGAPARSARRHELLVSTVATSAAVVSTVLLVAQPVVWSGWAPAPGLLQAMAPFAVALVFCSVRTVGERTWPRPRGQVRSAPLARRTVRSLGGVRLSLLLATAGGLAVVLVVCGLTADPTGRAFPTGPATVPDGGVVEGASGPYPGWPYAVPMLLGIAVAVAATLVTLRTITRRPPLHDVPPPADDAVRATSAARLLGAVQLCFGLALGLTLAVSGSAVRSGGRGLVLNGADDAGLVALGVALSVVGAAVALAAVVAAVLAAWPRPAVAPSPTKAVAA
ncbi:hypothetical protein GCM10009718_22040 [Isoptericola halotolerans]|uniref:FtsX-like permease family protein n=1 Tax=Isoptericola halotolerans TaxID=300560 RepID=A0ABX2A7L9_9MICO|nr:hypothetical protein [Isoptericola halotolerans]NOV98862.1 hypothetical protein [Isoptericola halotolerans]